MILVQVRMSDTRQVELPDDTPRDELEDAAKKLARSDYGVFDDFEMGNMTVTIPFETYESPEYTGIKCQSENHTKCFDYGRTKKWKHKPIILWQCAQCKKWLCYADGCADENYELCDSCVAELTQEAADQLAEDLEATR